MAGWIGSSSQRGSGGALRAVTGDWSLLRQAITSLKPGGGATFCMASIGLGDGLIFFPCLLSSSVLFCPLASSLASPRTLAVRPPSGLTGGWRGLSSGSNWPGGMQHLSPPRKPNWGGFYRNGLFPVQCLGSTQFLQRPPPGAVSSAEASSMGELEEAGRTLSGMFPQAGLQESFWWGYTI